MWFKCAYESGADAMLLIAIVVVPQGRGVPAQKGSPNRRGPSPVAWSEVPVEQGWCGVRLVSSLYWEL
jgi:hypothetical protein